MTLTLKWQKKKFVRRNNKIRARETRKRKKNYIRELEDRINVLEAENHELKQKLRDQDFNKSKESLQGEAIYLDKMKKADEEVLVAWMNGLS